MIKNKRFESALDILMTSVISLMIIYFLGVSGISNLFLFVPFIILLIRYDIKKFFISFLITIVGMYFITGILSTMIFGTLILIMSFVISNLIKKQCKIEKIVKISTFVYIGYIILTFSTLYFVFKVNMITDIKNSMENIVKYMEESLKSDINFSSNSIDLYIQTLKSATNYFISIIPGFLVVFAILIAFFNTVFSLKLLKKIGYEIKQNTKLNNFRLGNEFRAFATAVAIGYLISLVFKIKNIDLVMKNISFVLIFLLFGNGILTSNFLLERKFNLIVAYIIVMFVFVFLQGYMIFAFIGLMDLIVNLRMIFNLRESIK
ncbi:DUF2232 domain-containing protein [Helcococcus ovis]|uniref:DUF2232 domain-containing protein n=2 Tax=Helcococcus ovis TaxID=72026 RepID=UPI0038B9A4C8